MRINLKYPIAACLLVALVEAGAAQDSTAAKPRTTMNGVYTEAQATRGQETFAGQCQSCHTMDEHASVNFKSTWIGKPLSEFWVYLATSMPKSDPGILSQKEYAQLVAYVLKINGMPPGEAELPEDSAATRTIKFDTVAAADRFSVLSFGRNKQALNTRRAASAGRKSR